MNKAHLMNDPFFAGIMFQIESTIHAADRQAGASGMVLNDSHIKSCLNKVKTLANGKHPKAKPQTEREALILKLAGTLDKLRGDLRESPEPSEGTKPISLADWLSAVKAVEDSLKNNTMPGTRHYLDFLADFVGSARKLEPEADEKVPTNWWTRMFKSMTIGR